MIYNIEECVEIIELFFANNQCAYGIAHLLKTSTYDPCSVRQVVPQGYVLGPLFFIMFISDLEPLCCNAYSSSIYADDTNQLIANDNLVQSVRTANTCANDFFVCCKFNGLLVN